MAQFRKSQNFKEKNTIFNEHPVVKIPFSIKSILEETKKLVYIDFKLKLIIQGVHQKMFERLTIAFKVGSHGLSAFGVGRS